MILYHVSYNKVNHLFFFLFAPCVLFTSSLSLSLQSWSTALLGQIHLHYYNLCRGSNLDSVLHIQILQQVSVVFCSRWKKNKSYDISSSSTLSNENVRQTFQADVMASLLNADGPLSLGRSGCWTTFFRFMQCLCLNCSNWPGSVR